MVRIPQKIAFISISELVFSNTISHLRKIGNANREGIAYWTGIINKEEALVKSVIFADAYPEFNNEGWFAELPLQASLKLGETIHRKNEVLIAQIHSHPREAFHSLIDDQSPISHRIGFLSIVVPYFGKNVTSLSQCKIYEYLGKGEWRDLLQDEINDRFITNKRFEFAR